MLYSGNKRNIYDRYGKEGLQGTVSFYIPAYLHTSSTCSLYCYALTVPSYSNLQGNGVTLPFYIQSVSEHVSLDLIG